MKTLYSSTKKATVILVSINCGLFISLTLDFRGISCVVLFTIRNVSSLFLLSFRGRMG